MKRAILVNGVPASGKSTVTRQLVIALRASGVAAVPFTLDTVKEGLFAHIGTGNRDHNRMLGRASYHAIFNLLSDLPDSVVPVVDAWHGFQPKSVVADHLARAGFEPNSVIEIWCHVTPATAAERYRARSEERHAGHPPAAYSDELHELAQRAEPLGFAYILRVDTERDVDPNAFEAVLKSLDQSTAAGAIKPQPGEETVTMPELAERLLTRHTGQRMIVAVAGPPGSGKSHAAAVLKDALSASGKPAVFPMDGYHYDDAVLVERGLLPRKGAPETFDVEGFAHTLDRLLRNQEKEVAVPVFDRNIEVSRAGARIIGQDVDLLIVEGNYLLLDRSPWSDLRQYFDATVRLFTPYDILRERLTQRWISQGLSPEEITRKVDQNDLPNCRFVTDHSVPADFVVET